jgi:hypothetical protein
MELGAADAVGAVDAAEWPSWQPFTASRAKIPNSEPRCVGMGGLASDSGMEEVDNLLIDDET